MKYAALSICLYVSAGTPAAAQPVSCYSGTCFVDEECDGSLFSSKSSTRVVFTPPIQCDSSGSTATAAAAAGMECTEVESPIFEQEFDWSSSTTACVSSACAAAGAGGMSASACASTSASGILIESAVVKCLGACSGAEAAYASASAWIVISRESRPSTACVEFETEEAPNEVFFHIRQTSCCEWVISTPQGDLTSPGVLDIDTDPYDGFHEWEFCCDTALPGSTFNITATDVPLSSWDFNGDGRFNQADIDTVALVGVSCMAASVFECIPTSADIDGDGDVDAADVALLQDFLDCGIDTGIFGDADQDGDTDCDDKAAATVFPLASSPVIPILAGQAGYQLELDVDLDGDLDLVDQAAFYTLYFGCP